MYGELGFPHAERVYFDYASDEFKTDTVQNKLLDIGFMVFHGFDVRSMIHHTYSDAHLSVTENDVRYTICILMEELLHANCPMAVSRCEKLSTDNLIDVFFSYLISYYHWDPDGNHYIKSPEHITDKEIRLLNPWKEVEEKYVGSEFLYSNEHNLVIDSDKEIINVFNNEVKEDYKYHLNVPVYPWYGNPLKAKVVVLTLNPGYVERESIIARVIQNIPERYSEGYTEHLRTMLRFECGSFLPHNQGMKGMTYQDLANLHQNWYWEDRITNAFVTQETGLTFEDINSNFAVIQYIAYSSKKYSPFKRGKILPSQYYTRQLIEYLLMNRETIFIVPRNVRMWKQFLGKLWNEDRFIISKDYLGQRFTKNILGKEAFERVVTAFKR